MKAAIESVYGSYSPWKELKSDLQEAGYMDGLVEHRHAFWDQVNLDMDTTWLGLPRWRSW